MSNAVPLLPAAIVQSDLPIKTEIVNKEVSQHSTSSSPSSNKLSLSSSSNSEANSTEEQLNLSMTTNNCNNSNTTSNAVENTTNTSTPTVTNAHQQAPKNAYYHPNQTNEAGQQTHYLKHPSLPLNLNHFNLNQAPMNGTGLQYIQLNSNSNSTPINSGSPISSSLTSSPSTLNSSIQYMGHQPAHLNKYHSGMGHFGHQLPQHQQFQQLQQFHSQFQPTNYKDTRWLTLEVCREFQRNKCNRNETECKFAHPPPHVEIINGKVIACYDSLKVRTNFIS